MGYLFKAAVTAVIFTGSTVAAQAATHPQDLMRGKQRLRQKQNAQVSVNAAFKLWQAANMPQKRLQQIAIKKASSTALINS